MELTLRSLMVLSPDEVAMTLADEAGGEVTFRFTSTQARGIQAICGDHAFCDQYQQVPGPALPIWPERLAAAAREPLPASDALDQLIMQARAEVAERWRVSSPDS